MFAAPEMILFWANQVWLDWKEFVNTIGCEVLLWDKTCGATMQLYDLVNGKVFLNVSPNW